MNDMMHSLTTTGAKVNVFVDAHNSCPPFFLLSSSFVDISQSKGIVRAIHSVRLGYEPSILNDRSKLF